jgi:hypothetical protein
MKTKKQTKNQISEEAKKILTQQVELRNKRRELILKILGQLYKGQIGNLLFKKGLVYKTNYYENYNYMKRCNEEKRQQQRVYSTDKEFDGLKEELLKNIHDISKKLNEENLSILEFLMNNMEMTWEATKKGLKDMKQNIQEIKNRCANYLLLMQIEESNQ